MVKDIMATKVYGKETVDKVKKLLEETDLTQLDIASQVGVSNGFVSKVKKIYGITRSSTPKDSVEFPKVDPTDARILELEKKVIVLRDEKSQLSKAYNAAQRQNSLYQALSEEIKDTVKPIAPLPAAPKIQGSDKRINESVVLHLSDEHFGDVVQPHQVGGLENYNMRVALRRAEVLVDSTIKFTQHTLKGYDFDTLYVLANGDHVSGEIHNAKEHSEYRNIFKTCITCGQMHAMMLRDLSPHFNDIKIIYLSGNHGRRSTKKDYNSPLDNWDYLVAETAKAYAQRLDNVEFIIPDSFAFNLDINGHGFHVAHGDDVRSWNSIPWYGIERKTRRLLSLNCQDGNRVSYFCFGHFHTPAEQAALSGETLLNGTFVATSPYVYNSLSSFIEPTQLLHGVHKDHGVSWRLHVKLRSPGEIIGPQRYSVILKGLEDGN
jgi:transcriptional regulator with XRE-family HTH domain